MSSKTFIDVGSAYIYIHSNINLVWFYLLTKKISKVIADAVFTGEEGDGIIAINDVENVLNIASKKKDSEAL